MWFDLKPSPGPWAHGIYWAVRSNANEPDAGFGTCVLQINMASLTSCLPVWAQEARAA